MKRNAFIGGLAIGVFLAFVGFVAWKIRSDVITLDTEDPEDEESEENWYEEE